MKKSVILFLCLFSGSAVFSQIPNSGFENWENYTDYGEGEQNCPPNVYQKPVSWVGALPRSCQIKSFSIEKNSESYPAGTGSYSMVIKSDTINDSNGIASSFENFAQWPFPPSFPIHYRPTSLCLYYKFFPQYGDTMVVACRFYKNGVLIGNPAYTSLNTVSNWTALQIPMEYYTAEVPDSATILMTTFITRPHNNSRLYVDNISFDTFILAETPSVSSSVPEIYPNPSGDYLNFKGLTGNQSLEVYDISGRCIMHTVLGINNRMDVRVLSSGLYFIKIKSSDNGLLKFIKN